MRVPNPTMSYIILSTGTECVYSSMHRILVANDTISKNFNFNLPLRNLYTLNKQKTKNPFKRPSMYI